MTQNLRTESTSEVNFAYKAAKLGSEALLKALVAYYKKHKKGDFQ